MDSWNIYLSYFIFFKYVHLLSAQSLENAEICILSYFSTFEIFFRLLATLAILWISVWRYFIIDAILFLGNTLEFCSLTLLSVVFGFVAGVDTSMLSLSRNLFSFDVWESHFVRSIAFHSWSVSISGVSWSYFVLRCCFVYDAVRSLMNEFLQ